MSSETLKGALDASNLRVAIVASSWHEKIVDSLVAEALETLKQCAAKADKITVVRVSGCFEIPLLCKELAASGHYQGVIALGALIRGDTDHYQLIAQELAAGLMKVSLETGVAVAFGVITANTMRDALKRAGGSVGNKGREAALAAIETANALIEVRKLHAKRH